MACSLGPSAPYADPLCVITSMDDPQQLSLLFLQRRCDVPALGRAGCLRVRICGPHLPQAPLKSTSISNSFSVASEKQLTVKNGIVKDQESKTKGERRRLVVQLC